MTINQINEKIDEVIFTNNSRAITESALNELLHDIVSAISSFTSPSQSIPVVGKSDGDVITHGLDGHVSIDFVQNGEKHGGYWTQYVNASSFILKTPPGVGSITGHLIAYKIY